MRHQLPALSPLTAGGLVGGALDAVLRGGDAQAALEDHLGRRFRADRVLLLDSGTHALQLALVSVRERGPVALPAYSCFDLVTAAVGAGVEVRFYDVDPHSLSPDPESFRRVCEAGVGSVVAGNLYGYPVDWTEVSAAARNAGAFVIEDAAQGIGSRWGERPGGTFGDATVLSFGRGKGWTGGGGGALLTRGDAGARLSLEPFPARLAPTGAAARLRAPLVAAIQWALGRPALYGLPMAIPGLGLGETHFVEPSSVSPMPPFAAATLLRHREEAEAEIAIRRTHAEGWRETLAAVSGTIATPVDPLLCGASAFHRLPLLARSAPVASKLCAAMRQRGVAPGYPTPLHRLPALARLPGVEVFGDDLPGAERLAHTLLTLPTHSRISDGDRAAILRVLESANSS